MRYWIIIFCKRNQVGSKRGLQEMLKRGEDNWSLNQDCRWSGYEMHVDRNRERNDKRHIYSRLWWAERRNQDVREIYGGRSVDWNSRTRLPRYHLVCNVDMLPNSICFMDTLTRWVVGSASIITPVAVLAMMEVDSIGEEVHFEEALEEQLIKRGWYRFHGPGQSQCHRSLSLAYLHTRTVTTERPGRGKD